MIHYIIGDATYPIGDGRKIICHVCNDLGVWGAGFVLALSRRWPDPERHYRTLSAQYRRQAPYISLGIIQSILVEPDITVINMIAQHGVGTIHVEYPALRSCLGCVSVHALNLHASIHMPRIGCGLAGGAWDIVEPIIDETLHDHEVYVYDLPSHS